MVDFHFPGTAKPRGRSFFILGWPRVRGEPSGHDEWLRRRIDGEGKGTGRKKDAVEKSAGSESRANQDQSW